MPNSKQTHMGKGFYSRKFNRWFRSFDSYKRYDSVSKGIYRRKNLQYLKYDKSRDMVFDSRTGKYLKKPLRSYR